MFLLDTQWNVLKIEGSAISFKLLERYTKMALVFYLNALVFF